MATRPSDPLRVNERLYRQLSELLSQLETGDVTLRDRVAALAAIGRIQAIFVGLRKEHKDDPNAGAAVRKYAGAFKAQDGTRGRKKAAGRAALAAVADDDDDDDESA